MKPNFDESTVVEMHHLQTCLVQSVDIEKELQTLWKSYFEWAGVPKENISYQLVPDSGLKDSGCDD